MKIETPREFFDHVVTPDVEALKGNAIDLRCVYHACTSLLSLRDWVQRSHRGVAWQYCTIKQPTFKGVRDFQSALEILDKRFAIITDIANASKHMVLDPNRSRTQLDGNANTEVQMMHGGGLGSGPLGAAPLGGMAYRIAVKIGQTYHDVLDCVIGIYAIWQVLMSENSW
jgi:hypothetical protein